MASRNLALENRFQPAHKRTFAPEDVSRVITLTQMRELKIRSGVVIAALVVPPHSHHQPLVFQLG